MENRSNKTHLCSVIWNFVERNEEGSTATCNECKKNGKETRWLRTHPGQNGLSFPISNIRTHLRRVHKIQLDEVQYDDSTPGNNKRIGYVQNKYNCPFCGMNFDSKNLKLQWSGTESFKQCKERSRFMANGYSLAFSEDTDIIALKKFNEWTVACNQLTMDLYEVYMWFMSPSLKWSTVFYIGMTRASKNRIDHALKYDFPKLYPERTVYRLVIKNHLSKTCAECLESSLQTCFDAEKIPLSVKLDFVALVVHNMDYMELRNAAIAFFRMAVATGAYSQHLVANAAPSTDTPKSSRKRSSNKDEEDAASIPTTPDTPSTSLQHFSFDETQVEITKKILRPGFKRVAVPNVPSSQPY